MSESVSPEMIDALLPQTQCGLCGFAGCMPYATALANNQAAINLCPPGGVETLEKLALLLDQDAKPYLAEMEKNTKPKLVATIREAECIGCTKCIQACPVDAILGAAKQMHVILTAECTGCELCIAPCPVDCIDLISAPGEKDPLEKANLARMRFQARNQRLEHLSTKEIQREKEAAFQAFTIEAKQDYIQEALQRKQNKKRGNDSSKS